MRRFSYHLFMKGIQVFNPKLCSSEGIPLSLEAGSREICLNRMKDALSDRTQEATKNLSWLLESMPPFFFVTMKNETDALANLILGLSKLLRQRKLTLTDEERKLIVARLDTPGSLYDTLRLLHGREISYAEFTHSCSPIPGGQQNLEVLKFEFDRKTHEEITRLKEEYPPAGIRRAVKAALKDGYPDYDLKELNRDLNIIWLNNRDYVLLSPPWRVARLLWLYRQCLKHDGIFLDVEKADGLNRTGEHRILFSVSNPPRSGFLTQIMEVFKRLGLGVRRSYSLNISNGLFWTFLASFYVVPREKQSMEKGSSLVSHLQRELYNTQILSTDHTAYTTLVVSGLMNGDEASLAGSILAFCQTTLAHYDPDRYDADAVRNAFFSSPEIIRHLLDLFRARFDPELKDREQHYAQALRTASEAVTNYYTGHRHFDEVRRKVYSTCLLFVTHTLKTNFFVPEKHALSFRLDPAYLSGLGPEMTRGLPERIPFRITFFSGRRGYGYHIGFSDIARGGWRTIVCKTADELAANTDSLFREVFVLAHTQHLKNKDIYEGGSKMTVIIDARDLDSTDAVARQIHKLQYGFTNAFLDLIVTENRHARDPRVVDYYGDDEPIELGPDENMHDVMVEVIARQAVKRGYVLGIGIMSSKRVGINHKHYGVTSRGVFKFASIAMKQLDIDMHRDAFTVKITGGPNGDVAGNSMKLLIKNCPGARILSIIDASGAFYDPAGADTAALSLIIHRGDIEDFDPERLHPGGFILYSRQTRQEALKVLYRKVARTADGVEESWITADQLHREQDQLMFSVSADLFLPCGGRPETIDAANCRRLFAEDGTPTVRAIVEGANSYLSPDARKYIQQQGVIILRDASANKCGVISSSYEIIANLLMTEAEFLRHKEAYVSDVLKILDRRAEDEANLIFKRYQECGGRLLYTDISNAISNEINDHYDRLFAFYQGRPDLVDHRLSHKALLQHMPDFIRMNAKYRARVARLPFKIKCAILSSEIAASIVYHGGWDTDLESRLQSYLAARFSRRAGEFKRHSEGSK